MIHRIETPAGSIVHTGKGNAQLKFNPLFSKTWTGRFSRKQQFIDSTVLRYCDPLIPKRTGMLIKSGILGTVIGSGLVRYIAPYGRHQYYNTPSTRSYDPQRGSRWFERMKNTRKKEILEGAAKIN